MKSILLVCTFLIAFSQCIWAQNKDEAYIKKLTQEFDAKKAKMDLPLVSSKIDYKTLYLDENRKPLRGVDVISKDSSNFKSPANGYVTAIFPDDTKYQSIIVCHGDYFMVYSHVEISYVHAMQSLKEGDYIGTASADKQGNKRLHVEIWYNADKLWPPDWFKKPN